MRYRKPFTLAQRQKAIAACRSFGTQLKTIQSQFRPVTEEQRTLVRELRKTAKDLVDALRVPDAKVDVARVSELIERADYLGLQYAMLWLAKPPERFHGA